MMDPNPSEHDAWNRVAPLLESFLEAWEQNGQPPGLEPFLPHESSDLRQLATVELIKLDMEQRLEKQLDGWHLESYASHCAELWEPDVGPPVDLICEEYQLRRAVGSSPSLEEYQDRFPGRSEELERLLATELGGTTLQPVARPTEVPRFEAGRTVEGFQLIRLLGEGAFAKVFLAYQVSMQRFVALKVSNDFSSEPQMLAQLDHPHIVRVYDQCEVADQPVRLLYMEYLPGGTLACAIPKIRELPASWRTGRILLECLEQSAQSGVADVPDSVRRQLSEAPWSDVVCRLGAKLAEALDYAHHRKVLHRDIKPANVLLTADGTPKLADFNIGFHAPPDEHQDRKVTADELLGGTLDYMSPEQLEACDPEHARTADEVDERSDIYSLAVLLWELLHGELPFPRPPSASGEPLDILDAFRVLAEQRRIKAPQLPAEASSGSARPLQRVLLRCLQADPDQRYASGGLLARDLRLCLEPRTLHLMEPPRGGWRRAVAGWPLLSILAVALVPHASAGVFNLAYNQQAIVTHLTNSQETFWRVQLVINCIAFPLGLFLLGWLTWPVVRQLKAAQPSRQADHLAFVRRRSLQLGHITAIIGTSEWLVAGLAYPISLQVLVGGLTFGDYLHFAASLALCGLIAAAYPFFLVTALVTRTIYPALFRQSDPASDDRQPLERLNGLMNGYLLMAGGVPALAMLALLITGIFTAAQHTFALIVLSILGALGFAVAFALYRLLQKDLAALEKAGGSRRETHY